MRSALTILIGAALAYVWRYVWAGPDGVIRRVLAVVVVVVGVACFALAGVTGWGLTRTSAMNGAIIAFIVLFVVVGVSLLVTAKHAFQKESL